MAFCKALLTKESCYTYSHSNYSGMKSFSVKYPQEKGVNLGHWHVTKNIRNKVNTNYNNKQIINNHN